MDFWTRPLLFFPGLTLHEMEPYGDVVLMFIYVHLNEMFILPCLCPHIDWIILHQLCILHILHNTEESECTLQPCDNSEERIKRPGDFRLL